MFDDSLAVHVRHFSEYLHYSESLKVPLRCLIPIVSSFVSFL